MAFDAQEDRGVNPSLNPTFTEVVAIRLSRREVLIGGLGAAVMAGLGLAGDGGAEGLTAFQAIPVSTDDRVVVPPGYRADVLYAWGDPISDGPAFRSDASNSAADQERQAGMHHDGITAFAWDVFILGGDPRHAEPAKRETVKGDGFGSPDGLWFDARGVLWIQTDVSTSALGKGDYTGLGNNAMLVANPATREVRRFLVGPNGCEVTGVTTTTPDGRSMFVNIQHPGETASERSDPARPTAVSAWPDGRADGRPRSSTIVITKHDGGVIGT